MKIFIRIRQLSYVEHIRFGLYWLSILGWLSLRLWVAPSLPAQLTPISPTWLGEEYFSKSSSKISIDDLFRCQKPRKEGGLGDMTMPLLADKNMAISRAYGVLKEDEGLRWKVCHGVFLAKKYIVNIISASEVCLWSTTRELWGKSQSTIFLLAEMSTKPSALFRLF